MDQVLSTGNTLPARVTPLVRSASADFSSKLFLVVDRVQEMQRAISMSLNAIGINRVDYATRPSEALSRLGSHSYDAVLCDYDLGRGYDGLHLLEEIKHRNLIKQSCVFMIVTAERRSERVISAAELAPDAYLLKPFTGEQMRVRLERSLRRRGALMGIDDYLLRNEFLDAITECDKRIAAHDEFMLDFMKLKGSLCLKTGDYVTARALYQEVVKIKPLPWAQMGLAKSLTELKQYEPARVLFEEVLKENNRLMEGYDWLARVYEAKQDLAQAEATLKTATQLSPVVMRRQKRLGEVAMLNEDYPTATAAFEQTIELAKYSIYRCADDYAALARAHLASGNISAAQEVSSILQRELRGEEVADWVASLVDCQVAAASQEAEKGNALLDAAVDKHAVLSKELSDDCQLELVHACYRNGREDVGRRIVQQLVMNNHDNEALLERVTQVFQLLGRKEDGIKLIADNVQSVVDLNNEAVRLAQAGQLEAAVACFRQALEEVPSNTQIMLNAVNAILALVHRKGWQDEFIQTARDYLERVRRSDAANGKFQKLLASYRSTVEKHGQHQWML